MRHNITKHKPYFWNARKRTSILDILVSQKQLHKPKTSTSMLWIGSKIGASSSNYSIIRYFITSLIILSYISHPCAALQSRNSVSSQKHSSILTSQTDDSRYFYILGFRRFTIDTGY